MTVAYTSVMFSHLPYEVNKLHMNELLDILLHRWVKVIKDRLKSTTDCFPIQSPGESFITCHIRLQAPLLSEPCL